MYGGRAWSIPAARAGGLDALGFALEETSDRLADPDTKVWLDLRRDQDNELARVSKELGLHVPQ